MGSIVKVTNVNNGLSVDTRINDRAALMSQGGVWIFQHARLAISVWPTRVWRK
jgi:hypothetical protein